MQTHLRASCSRRAFGSLWTIVVAAACGGTGATGNEAGDSVTVPEPSTGSPASDAGHDAPGPQDDAATGEPSARGDAGAPPSDAGVSPSPRVCGLPDVTDYEAPGPFADAARFDGVGPGGNYTLYRPTSTLGRDGARHPLAVWGNGISTIPAWYGQLLTFVASHGFVVIACNDTQAERPCLDDGMTWLVAQNDAPGELQGKLDVTREVTIGYSWGGGAAIDTSDRENVVATVSLHGMPPRGNGSNDVQGAFDRMHAPLLLFTSRGDSFVSADEYVTPNYERSQVETFYATLLEDVGHLYPVDEGAAACGASLLLGGPCAGAVAERAPLVAFLRYWTCGDEAARTYFFGAGCRLCDAPWSSTRKPVEAWN